MSLCTPLTVSPARIEANRRNAQKSTRSRTARGKLQSRMDALRDGGVGPFTPTSFWRFCMPHLARWTKPGGRRLCFYLLGKHRMRPRYI